MKNRNSALAFASAIVLSLSTHTHAASASWTGSTNSSWSDAGNWSGTPAVVPSVAGDIATFDGDGIGNTSISTIPTLALNQIYFDGDAAAYAFSSNITWSIPADGGVTVTNLVTNNQDLSGIQFLRPAVNTTANFVNQAANTTLKLGTIFANNNGGTTVTNARLRFAPAADAIIEIPTLKTLDNSGTGGAKKMSLLLDDGGTLKIGGAGNYNGTDADGNSVTIRRGTLIPTSVIPASTTRSSLGSGGRIQFGEAGQTYAATLRYENTTASTTDRPFHIMDGNTAVFDIVNGATTMELTGVITASGTASGGGNLTKKGLGTLKISGASNSHNGVTRIEEGTLILGNLLAIQNSAFDTSSPGTLDLSGLTGNPTFGGLTSSTAYNLPSSLTLSPPTGRTVTFSGILGESGTLRELTKSGGGTQVLSGDNSFTGNVFVTAGRLTLAHSNALGLADPNPPYNGRKGLVCQGSSRSIGLTGNITIPSFFDFFLSSNSFDGGGIENLSGNNEIQAKIYFSVGNAALNIASTTGTLTVSGDISMTETTRTLYLGGASANNNTISGDITETLPNGSPNTNVMPVTKQGAGKWILSGTNTYKGDTTINGGTLVLASTGSTRFLPKSDVSSNKITGNGTGFVTLDGALNIELANTTTAPDNSSWLLIDVNNVGETYGPNFTVTGFTPGASGTWTKTEGGRLFTFTQSNGRLVVTPALGNTYASWLTANAPATGFITDSDFDGVPNGVEHVLGSNPNTSSAGLTNVSATASSATFAHSLNPSLATDVSYSYEWSSDLVEWKASGIANTAGAIATIAPSTPVSGVVTVTTTLTSGTATKLFTRIKASNP
jgi:autotransporter-associated beta strand protein